MFEGLKRRLKELQMDDLEVGKMTVKNASSQK